VIVDGNRRWAKQRLLERTSYGHRAGAKKVVEFLDWCDAFGIQVVTLYLLSADNLSNRAEGELQELFTIIGELAAELARQPQWRIQHVGSPEGLSSELIATLQ